MRAERVLHRGRTPSRARRISAISLSVTATPSAGLTAPGASRI